MIDLEELPIQAAARELKEETGYEAEKLDLIGEYLGHSKMYFHQYLFVAHNCRKSGELKMDPGEKIRIKLVSFDEFLMLVRMGEKFACPLALKFFMYEVLLDQKKKAQLHTLIFGL